VVMQNVIKIPVSIPGTDANGRNGKQYLTTPSVSARKGTGQYLQVLLAENSVHDELSIITELHRGGFEVTHSRVETAQKFEQQLKAKPWDLVICDYGFRDATGLVLLQAFQRAGQDIPFIMVSAVMGEETAVEALKAGANDYIMKQNLTRLLPAVVRELEFCRQRQVRRRTETFQAYLASMVESCNDAIVGHTLNGTIVAWNKGAERLFGYSASEIIGRPAALIMPEFSAESCWNALNSATKGDAIENIFTMRRHKDGSSVEVSLSISPIKDATGRTIGASTVARDATSWKQEESLRLGLIQDLTSALAVKIHHIQPTASC
jgi:PAS domain S-box-containing protein